VLLFYRLLQHGEVLVGQRRAMALVARLPDRGDPERGENRRYGLPYVDVIERFGRFPHRNAILGRESTPEELAFIAKPKPGPDPVSRLGRRRESRDPLIRDTDS
jgi:uncharacterized protein (DUF924 family)